MWESLNEYNRYYEESITHYNISQRWIVVYSEKAKARAEKNLNRACENDKKKIEKALWHLSNQAYGCKDDAEKALKKIAKNSRYYKIQSPVFTEKNIYDKKGRPKKGIKPASHQYFINANVVLDEEAVKNRLDEKSCFVIGTNINKEALPTNTVINAYKGQNPSIENTGFRFLKDPLFFVSSLYLKKPSRIMGLLAVMTLALLVYSIAQRRLRKALEEHGETLPNQINAPTSTPTLRWIFQMMDGINFVKVKMGKLVNNLIEGMTDIKKKIICCFGECVMQIYDISENVFLGAAGGSM